MQKEQTLKGVVVPLLVTHKVSGVQAAIGVYPTLLDKDSDTFDHPLLRLEDTAPGVPVVLLRDFVVSRDLPTAYAEVREKVAF